MHRAFRALVALSLATACSHPAPHTAATATTSACSAVNEDVFDDTLGPEPEWGTRISRVEIRRGGLLGSVVQARVHTRAGETLEPERVRADVSRLLDLEAVENVRVELDGSVLRYVIEARPLIHSVVFRGSKPPDGRWLPLAKGELYDPVRVARMRSDLERSLLEDGHLRAHVETRHAKAGAGVDVCVVVRAGPRFVLDRIQFRGESALTEQQLFALLVSGGTVNRPGKPFRKDLLDIDIARISIAYYDRGFLAVHVDEPIVSRDDAHGKVSVTIPIVEGRRYHVGSIRFVGVPAKNQRRYAAALELGEGQIFAREQAARGLERVKQLVRRERGSEFDVETQTELRTETGSVDWVLTVKAPE